MSQPYPECEFCGSPCSYKLDAERVVRGDYNFVNDVLDILAQGNIDGVVESIFHKAAGVFKDPDQAVGLAFCLFTLAAQELDIPDELKKKMARSIKLKVNRLGEDYRKDSSILARISKGVKETVRKVEEGVEKVKAGVEKGLTSTKELVEKGVAATKDLVSKVKGKAEVETAPPEAPVKAGPIQKVADWIKADSKAMADIESVSIIDDNHIRVQFDLNSDGFVPYVDVEIEAKEVELPTKDERSMTMILATFSAPVGFNYIYDIAIGPHPSEKLPVAVSIMSGGQDVDSVLGELKAVSMKDQLSWDRAMLAINNEKKLRKKIAMLQSEAPAPGMPNVLVPIIINRHQGKYIINATTYIGPSNNPGYLFYDIIDEIAGTLDFLGEINAESQNESISSGGGLGINESVQKTDFSFHYLPKDDKVSVKVCPHCGRPLELGAEYRRCPHCFQKLDTSF